jgi:hypothetical protein
MLQALLEDTTLAQAEPHQALQFFPTLMLPYPTPIPPHPIRLRVGFPSMGIRISTLDLSLLFAMRSEARPMSTDMTHATMPWPAPT